MQDIAQNPECSFTITEEFDKMRRARAWIRRILDARRLVFTGKMADIADAGKADEASRIFSSATPLKKWPADITEGRPDIEHIWMIDTRGCVRDRLPTSYTPSRYL